MFWQIMRMLSPIPQPTLRGFLATFTRRLGPPDLESQYEDLLDSVWESERNWNFDDRLDLAVRFDQARWRATVAGSSLPDLMERAR